MKKLLNIKSYLMRQIGIFMMQYISKIVPQAVS